ncbi:uncharacterized protein LOC108666112 isoform X2 [Hyalella azteca]|uniref:Uncharacterized protein LOC108666112 isoform X2 n=1 Tax=Hyalella azteca TaxID=294128 RepID=A0A8B7N509_HYAAZ|nr:uncharacterized protein LOC108666112 isoform X2 [Hyalella azteca]
MGVDNCKNFRICGKHFSAMQYKRDFRFELCSIKRGKNYRDLKEDAIPDQYLPLPATLLNDSTQFGSGVLQQLSDAAVRSGRCPNSSLTQASPGGNKVKSEALEKIDPPPVLEVPAIYIKEEPEDVTEEGSIKEEPFLCGNELGGVDEQKMFSKAFEIPAEVSNK